jgi:hypothetical protein
VTDWETLEDLLPRIKANCLKQADDNVALVLETGVLLQQVTDLKAEVDRLTKLIPPAPPPPPVPSPTEPTFLWKDDFTAVPKDRDQGGPYLLDAPTGAYKLIPGGLECLCASNQPLDRNGTRRRSELGLPEQGAAARIYRRDPYGQERWYAVSMRFPAQFADSSKVVIHQHHGGHADPGDTGERNPPLSLEFQSALRRLRWVQAPFETTPRKTLWERVGVEAAKWYRFVVHAKWSAKADGFLEIFLDGQSIVKLTGQNGYDDADAFTFCRTCEIYWPQATASPTDYPTRQEHRVQFAKLRLGDERNKLEDFI